MKFKAWFYLLLMSAITIFCNCNKYLDAKPDKNLAIPETLNDLKLLLDNYITLNISYPDNGEIAADNFYLTDASWGSSSLSEQNYYLWQPYDNSESEYSASNKVITITNIILESLQKIILYDHKDSITANKIKGSACFIRAFRYWELAQNFCNVYKKSGDNNGFGIPIRTSSIIFGKFPRGTVKQTYQQIIADLEVALLLLPDTAKQKYEASKASTYGLLSRVYLSMQEYEKAGKYADSSLQLYNVLMDYNSDPFINKNSKTIPFAKWNPEVVYDAVTKSSKALARTRALIDTTLYAMYDKEDLRKMIFFEKNSNETGYYFKGNYTGESSAAMFCGITTDEMYLNRAECAARDNNLSLALSDINTLLKNRFVKDEFVPVSINDKDALLRFILNERRKELIFRELRWTDLRRLNEEEEFKITLTRNINGQVFHLTPGSDRYTFLLPYQAIEIGDIEQNP